MFCAIQMQLYLSVCFVVHVLLFILYNFPKGDDLYVIALEHASFVTGIYFKWEYFVVPPIKFSVQVRANFWTMILDDTVILFYAANKMWEISMPFWGAAFRWFWKCPLFHTCVFFTAFETKRNGKYRHYFNFSISWLAKNC